MTVPGSFRGNARIIVLVSRGVADSQLLLALVPHWVAAGMGYIGMLTYVVRPAVMVLHQEIVTPRWRSAMSGATLTAAGLIWALTAFAGG